MRAPRLCCTSCRALVQARHGLRLGCSSKDYSKDYRYTRTIGSPLQVLEPSLHLLAAPCLMPLKKAWPNCFFMKVRKDVGVRWQWRDHEQPDLGASARSGRCPQAPDGRWPASPPSNIQLWPRNDVDRHERAARRCRRPRVPSCPVISKPVAKPARGGIARALAPPAPLLPACSFSFFESCFFPPLPSTTPAAAAAASAPPSRADEAFFLPTSAQAVESCRRSYPRNLWPKPSRKSPGPCSSSKKTCPLRFQPGGHKATGWSSSAAPGPLWTMYCERSCSNSGEEERI